MHRRPISTYALPQAARSGRGCWWRPTARGRSCAMRPAFRSNGWSYGTVRHRRDDPSRAGPRGRAVEHFLPVRSLRAPAASGPPLVDRLDRADRGCETRILARDPSAQAAMIERRFGLSLGEIALDGPLHAYPLSLGLARRFVGERLALSLGDAAHVIHPIAWQGLNLGLKDAAALAEAVVDQLRLGLDPGAPEPLAAYERARRFDTAQMASRRTSSPALFERPRPCPHGPRRRTGSRRQARGWAGSRISSSDRPRARAPGRRV